ncbi:HEAT repeat domain-containing protein [Aliinostoc sp. HNIBRCY26]|uniref:HEAT repeat domain-containing protein n=1 Tax=Aliinostoc sp. HNIBRCY26 TaxID=3418997 RepID=UPI003D02AA66
MKYLGSTVVATVTLVLSLLTQVMSVAGQIPIQSKLSLVAVSSNTESTSPLAQVNTSSTKVTHLIEQLKTDNREEREKTLVKLATIGQEAIPTLIKALKDPDKRVRSGVCKALGRIYHQASADDASAAVPSLIVALQDSEVEVRRSAAFALSQMPLSTPLEKKQTLAPHLAIALKDQDRDVRIFAALTLESFVDNQTLLAVPEITFALQDSEPDVRTLAALALAKMNAFPVLIKALQDPNKNTRILVIDTLPFIDTKHEQTLPFLRDALTYLRDALKDPDPDVRHHAAITLGLIGAETSALFPELRATLQNPDPSLRANATFTLANIEIKPADLLSEIIFTALNDSDEQVRLNAIYALVREEYQTFGKELQAALKSPVPKVRQNAISIVGYIGSTGISAKANLPLPTLNSAIQEQWPNFTTQRGIDFLSFGEFYGTKIGVEPKTVFLELISALQDTDVEVRYTAGSGLFHSSAQLINTLSKSDAEIVISHFETTLKTLRNQKNLFSQQEIEALNMTLQELIKSQPN